MTRSPDKIKKALEFGKDNCLFVNGDCKDCAYGKECSTYDCDSMAELPRAMISDALAYIQQLEATVAEKEKVIAELSGKIGRLEAKRKQLLEKIELLEATSEE